jgi:D-alanyl-D-alanine carboxypeptidase (penicillin-binding protein 5/6)
LHVDGIKTGHTAQAGYNLVTSATKGGMRLISVVMGGHTSQGRAIESKKLLTWGFRFFDTVSPLDAQKELVTQKVWFGDKDFVKLGLEEAVYLTVPSNRTQDIEISYTVSDKELSSPIKYGQVVGKVSFFLDDTLIQQAPLVSIQQIRRGNIVHCIIDYVQLFFHRLFD